MVTCQNWGNPSPTKLFPELSRDDFQIRKYPHYIIENKRYRKPVRNARKFSNFSLTRSSDLKILCLIHLSSVMQHRFVVYNVRTISPRNQSNCVVC